MRGSWGWEQAMGLFDPVWMTNKADKKDAALAAVGKVRNPAQLERIVREAPIGEVRVAAAAKLGDQEALLEIASNNQTHLARKAAIAHLDEEHLVRFAGRKRLGDYNMYNGEEELLALDRITSSEALADLCLALRIYDFPHPSAGGRFGAAVRKRLGEAECAIVARKLIDRGRKIDPTGFLGSRIQSPELRRELGIDLDKAALVAQFEAVPRESTAQVLWPLLDDDEKKALQRTAVLNLCDGKMKDTIRFDGLIGYIDDQALYAQLLMANPNHALNLMKLIELIDDPAVLRRFLAMLEGRKVYRYPDINRVPSPAEDNFIIHAERYDHYPQTRIEKAARQRLAQLERHG